MNDLKNEEWRPVVGYEGLYEISNIGNVRRLPGYVRTGRGLRFWKGGPLKLQNGSEYFHVDLSKNGKRKIRVIHQLVADAFLGLKPDGCDLVRHFDGDCKNNKVENLIWGTSLENEADKDRHGRRQRGEKSSNAKLKDCEAKSIKEKHRSGVLTSVLAMEYGVSKDTIKNIAKGRSWKHI